MAAYWLVPVPFGDLPVGNTYNLLMRKLSFCRCYEVIMVVLVLRETYFSPQTPPVVPPQTASSLGITVLELLMHL